MVIHKTQGLFHFKIIWQNASYEKMYEVQEGCSSIYKCLLTRNPYRFNYTPFKWSVTSQKAFCQIILDDKITFASSLVLNKNYTDHNEYRKYGSKECQNKLVPAQYSLSLSALSSVTLPLALVRPTPKGPEAARDKMLILLLIGRAVISPPLPS